MASADNNTIEAICSATWEGLYRFVYYKVQNREEAEDITQETYARAMPYLQGGKVQPGKQLGFLRTVASNVLRDQWRRNKRRGAAVDIEAINPKEHAVEDETTMSAERQAIEQALTKLSKEQRQVIELRIIQGYSVSDTASVMGKEEGAIRVIQHRALQQLAAIMKHD